MTNPSQKTSRMPPALREKGRRMAAVRRGRKLRERMTISSLLLMTVLAAILAAGGVAGFYALNIVYRNKLIDTWAILFLELESQGHRILQRIEEYPTFGKGMSRTGRQPDVVVEVTGSNQLRKIYGGFPEHVSTDDLNLTTTKLNDKWSVLQFSGEDYLTVAASDTLVTKLLGHSVSDGAYFLMWKVNVAEWLPNATREGYLNKLYLLSKQGRVLFTNSPEITQTNYVQRPLVQKFISVPLNQGQLEFDAEEGGAYGFFYEVPNTNIVMFVETLKSVALASVRELAINYTIVLLFILGAVGILLQFPLSSLIAPMKELVRLAAEIGSGNFSVQPKQEGFGELRVLSNSFVEMAKNLNARDEHINVLLLEQQEKARLAGELQIAHAIQENFLSRYSLPEEAGLEVAAKYTPAEEVAGDWYGYFYNEKNGETVLSIADVSGHGAGSAMFTAIIAAEFEQTRAKAMGLSAFPLEDFVNNLNQLILKLGHGGVHATLLIARYKKGSGKVEFINAGHTFPVVIPPKETNQKPESVPLRSDPLGLSQYFQPVVKSIPFKRGTSILMFTDGLIEGSPDHRLYKEKRLHRSAQIESHQTVKQMLENIYEDWLDHLGGKQALDDVCLLAVKAA